MNAARIKGSWPPYSCPVLSFQSAMASSTEDWIPSEPSSPLSFDGRCSKIDQRKDRSRRCRARSKARSRSSSVERASSSSKVTVPMPPSLAGSAGAAASASAPTGGGEADPGHDEYRRTDAHGDDGAGFVAGIGFGVGSEEGRAAGGAWASVGGADVRGEGGVGVDDAVAVLVVPAFGALVGGGGGRLRPPRRRRVILKPSRDVAIRPQF